MTTFKGIVVLALIVSGAAMAAPPATAIVQNNTSTTACAEEDNVAVSFFAPGLETFFIEATHPSYPFGSGSCSPDFTNCPPPESGYAFTPAVLSLFDDGITVVEAVREASWWRPSGMNFRVNDNAPATDIHYVRIYRKIAGSNEWPQFFVLYADGNLRLIPHPPVGFSSVCFGSSVIVGPIAFGARPIAEVSSARYNSSLDAVEVTYASGGMAVLKIAEISRDRARVEVSVSYPTETLPFACFRSMYVTDGNADTDAVQWLDGSQSMHNDSVLSFAGGEGSDWLFKRLSYSSHNTSAPDIRLRLDQVPQLPTATIGSVAAAAAGAALLGILLLRRSQVKA